MCVYDCIGYVTGLFPTGGERTLVLTGHQRESETLLQLYAADDWKDVRRLASGPALFTPYLSSTAHSFWRSSCWLGGLSEW